MRVARTGTAPITRLLAPLGGLALAAALMAGCAPAPGAAAVVDGQAIGESDVASVVEQLNPFLQAPMSPSQAIQSLVAAPELIAVASEAGLGISEEDATATLDGLSAQTGIETDEFSDATVLVTRSLLASSAIQQDAAASDLLGEVSDRVSELSVTVSPRYGTWDGQAVAAPSHPWIVASQTPSQ